MGDESDTEIDLLDANEKFDERIRTCSADCVQNGELTCQHAQWSKTPQGIALAADEWRLFTLLEEPDEYKTLLRKEAFKFFVANAEPKEGSSDPVSLFKLFNAKASDAELKTA